MIVVINERLDLCLQICREEVVLQQDAVFQGLMPSLDLALCLRVARRMSLMALSAPVCLVCDFCLIVMTRKGMKMKQKSSLMQSR